MRMLIGTVLLLSACKDPTIGLGGGTAPDARLIADVYTWECEDPNTGDVYDGVFGYDVSFEYAPDGLVDRALPQSGCTRSLDIFPTDAGAGGVDIPKVDNPGWETASSSGVLDREAEGFYHDNVFRNQSGCSDAEALLGEGTSLTDSGPFSGATAPSAGTLTDVVLDGEVDENTGIPFGSVLTASWSAEGWDDGWVQIRREKDGALVESVTCTTEGEDSFTVDDQVWDLLSEERAADVTNLYVGVQAEDSTETADGQVILTYTRAMHVAVIQD